MSGCALHGSFAYGCKACNNRARAESNRNKHRRIYMPHPGHFICANNCGFMINTYVNGVIVSTVGELKYANDRDNGPFRPLGVDPDSLYESMVFRAVKSGHECCPWEIVPGQGLKQRRYKTAREAMTGHEDLLNVAENGGFEK